jgi:hypothetical protein
VISLFKECYCTSVYPYDALFVPDPVSGRNTYDTVYLYAYPYLDWNIEHSMSGVAGQNYLGRFSLDFFPPDNVLHTYRLTVLMSDYESFMALHVV